jgi:2-polyprenyl-6-methoxyphenol hydroxylase-like FAD-dependent oxidoreductase
MTAKPSTADAPTIDLLIVGAGPVGLTAALLFTELGHTVRIVDRRPGPQRAPAAHVLNARTFEVWRQIGIDVEAIRAAAQSPADAGRVYWVDRLGGNVFGWLPYEQQGDDQLAITPTPLRNLSQHHLEPLLLAELRSRGIEVEYGTTWQSHADHGSHVESHLAATADDDAVAEFVTSSWLLACDGAGSAVRAACGIAMDGPDNLQQFAMVHFRSSLDQLVGDDRGVLYWICDPSAGGTLIRHGHDEWVYMSSIDDRTPAPADDDAAAASVRRALVDFDGPIEVLRISRWTMTSQLAQHYRHGRVLLAGDAAHRFPPSGAMGLNTGVQDVHNLGWKLSGVLRGTLDESVLDTYGIERRPVAQRNALASLDNAFRMIEVFQALADPEHTGLSEAIARQAPHFDMLGLQLGYRYPADGSAQPIPTVPPTEAEVRTYTPSSEPGSRLPHGWVTVHGTTISTLDLVPLDRHVVIAGPTSTVAEPHLRVGRDFDDPHDWWGAAMRLAPDAHVVVRADQHIAH